MRRFAQGLREAFGYDDGADYVEMIIALPFLLVMIFGILELGNALDKAHAMGSLSREGANIAVRGSSLTETVNVTMNNGDGINLSDRGGAVASRIVVEGGVPTVKEQMHSVGFTRPSRLGVLNGPAPDLVGQGLAEGQELYAVEIFFDYIPVTPLSTLLGGVIPDTIYDRAIF